MSKSSSGLFNGTKGIVNDIKRIGYVSQVHSENTYEATKELKNHIENSEATTSGKDGIKGAHNKENFLKEVDRIGAKTIDSISSTQIEGVEIVSYKMPKMDKYGNQTGDYKEKIFKKTVYDPTIINTDTYIKRGLQAANEAANNSPSGKLGREWTGTDKQGVKWHGYCNKDGEIISFYPDK